MGWNQIASEYQYHQGSSTNVISNMVQCICIVDNRVNSGQAKIQQPVIEGDHMRWLTFCLLHCFGIGKKEPILFS